MDGKEFNEIFLLEIPVLKMDPPISIDLVVNPYSSNINLDNTIDFCQHEVKNQNDFSRQIITSGGMMYEKSRVLF